jgi:hypothetical protein
MVREANEGAMRRNVLQTWSVAWLVLGALLTAATATASRYRVDADEVRQVLESPARVEHCAAPRAFLRRPEIGHATNPRGAAVMLLVLMGRGGRLGGLPR